MTEDDYNEYIDSCDKFEQCLIDCAQEISQISNGRNLIGEFTGDIDLWDHDDKYLVQFEEYSDCESNTDSVFVPIEYIYNEGYREYYKKHLIQERKNKERAALEREKNKKVYRIVTDERAEYERLKKKFEEADMMDVVSQVERDTAEIIDERFKDV